MTDQVEQQTAISLAQARQAHREAIVAAEQAAFDAEELAMHAELAGRRVTRLARALAILNGEEVPEVRDIAPAVALHAAVPTPAPPAPPGMSVAEQIAARKAEGDPLAKRTAESAAELHDAPPPANRNHGPQCPGCGTPGSLQQTMISIKGMLYPGIACRVCGHQKAAI